MAGDLQDGGAQASGGTLYLVRVCLVATLGGLLFGYDTAVISGAIGFLQTHFDLTPAMKGWAAASALGGCVIGVAIAGVVSDRLGRKLVLMLAAVLFLVSALGTALPRNLTEFIIFRIVGGVGVGAASILSPLYIAEISPARIRGRMVSVNQLAIIFGMLVVYFVNYYIAGYGAGLDQQMAAEAGQGWNVQYGWRWMFGSESIPAVALLLLMFTVPESPRWLAKQNRAGDALSVLRRIGGRQQAETQLADIQTAIATESGSVGQLLQPRLRRVLVIGVALAVLQQVTGINVFLYYAPEIFKGIAGEDTDVALLQTIVVGAVNLLFTVVAIWTVDLIGRKPLMIAGNAGMGISLIALGLVAFYEHTAAWVLLFILGYIACFALSVGPVTWVILSEIFPTRIRGRAMAIAAFWLWVANFVVSQTFPMMDENPTLVGIFGHALPFWLYSVFCVVSVLFVWRVVPETKSKSLEEIELEWLGRANPQQA